MGSRTVVTGGTRGVGAAVVRRLLAVPDAEVVALGRSIPDPPPPWGREASARGALRWDGAKAEDAEAVLAAMKRADADGRGLTGLVVSAGLWEETPMDAAPSAIAASSRRLLEVNLLGAIHAVAAFLRRRRAVGTASIVLVGSTAGQRGEARHAAYAASKAGLVALAKTWAVELAPAVRVNVVAPGWVDTDMTRRVLGDARARSEIETSIPRGRVAQADEVAGAVAFLLGDDAAHVTGSVLSINGGAVLASH